MAKKLHAEGLRKSSVMIEDQQHEKYDLKGAMQIKKQVYKLLIALGVGLFNSILFCPYCFKSAFIFSADYQENNDFIFVFIYYFLVFVFTFELLNFGVSIISKKYNWIREPRKMIVANLLLLLVFYLPINYFAVEFNFRPYPEFSDNQIYFLKLINFLLALVILLYLNSIKFFSSWKAEKERAQKLLEHQTKHELRALKNQINPHFLFNNLNTLTHLVAEKIHSQKISFINYRPFTVIYWSKKTRSSSRFRKNIPH